MSVFIDGIDVSTGKKEMADNDFVAGGNGEMERSTMCSVLYAGVDVDFNSNQEQYIVNITYEIMENLRISKIKTTKG